MNLILVFICLFHHLILQVINYVMEKMVLDKPLDGGSSDATIVLGVSMTKTQVPSSGVKQSTKSWPKLMPSIDILCNNQASAAKLSMMKFWFSLIFVLGVLSPEMSLATVRTYMWKKPEDLILNYRVVQTR
ncbi:hypothetical protein BHE74_00011003 [Ensete ventricosum]|uniref:Uncharacterized protein n=1 Tax=Ensete ventricosum TaxID=4639 RepID=A0A427BA53_ENSVE|nr:hypothetical protein B296_00002883 [Ensete ventricosum]RWW80646.1 hypothetical protein BHE74_00011003 [Ensete ventricosum]